MVFIVNVMDCFSTHKIVENQYTVIWDINYYTCYLKGVGLTQVENPTRSKPFLVTIANSLAILKAERICYIANLIKLFDKNIIVGSEGLFREHVFD